MAFDRCSIKDYLLTYLLTTDLDVERSTDAGQRGSGKETGKTSRVQPSKIRSLASRLTQIVMDGEDSMTWTERCAHRESIS